MDENQKISVIIPVYNSAEMLKQCLAAVISSDFANYECVVVDDCSTDASTMIAREYGARVIELKGGPYGPAFARNRGVEAAQGEFVYFIDSDVVIKPDTLSKVAQSFEDFPEYDALFGSYDESPGDGQFLSIYKNLSHHYVHQQANQDGHTFWTGCGAIRRDVFLELGGFDIKRYPRPSIEDIELGGRLGAAGHRILVNKDIQVKHLKRWTLLNLLKTDVFDRGIPWTLLILQQRNLPNDLNLNRSQRWSTILLVMLLAYLGIGMVLWHSIVLLPMIAGLYLAVLSSWQLSGSSSIIRMSIKAGVITFLLLGATAALGVLMGLSELLLPLGVLLVLLLIGRVLSLSGDRAKALMFDLAVFIFIAALGLLLLYYPVWVVLPMIIVLGLITILNRNYYLFYYRLRGLVFALAVLPFHLLYYVYSFIAFGAGYTIHYSGVWFKPGVKTQKQA